MNNDQTKLLKYLSKMHKIFVENNVKYSLESGTALGAVRNGKFIPWDDDIDITVNYNDMQKIYEILNTDEEWTIDNGLKNRKSMLIFTRIYTKDYSLHIDIVPHMHTNKQRSKYLKLLAEIKWFRNYPIKIESNKKLKPFFIILKYFLKLIPGTLILKLYNRKINKLNEKGNKFFTLWNSQLNNKNPRIEKFNTELKMINFEGKNFYIFNNIDEVLVNYYGPDYLIPKKW